MLVDQLKNWVFTKRNFAIRYDGINPQDQIILRNKDNPCCSHWLNECIARSMKLHHTGLHRPYRLHYSEIKYELLQRCTRTLDLFLFRYDYQISPLMFISLIQNLAKNVTGVTKIFVVQFCQKLSNLVKSCQNLFKSV